MKNKEIINFIIDNLDEDWTTKENVFMEKLEKELEKRGFCSTGNINIGMGIYVGIKKAESLKK